MWKDLNLRTLSRLEVSRQYQSKISKWYAALENFSDSEDTNRAWENIKENIKASSEQSQGLYELKQRKPWFDEERSGFLYQKKRAKVRWLQDPSGLKCGGYRIQAG